jgi:transposase-like protein
MPGPHAELAAQIGARYGTSLTVLLTEWYLARWWSQEQIARELGVDQTTVSVWLKRYQIPTRRRPRVPVGAVSREGAHE